MREIDTHGSVSANYHCRLYRCLLHAVARTSILCLVSLVGLRVPLLDGGTLVEACDSL